MGLRFRHRQSGSRTHTPNHNAKCSVCQCWELDKKVNQSQHWEISHLTGNIVTNTDNNHTVWSQVGQRRLCTAYHMDQGTSFKRVACTSLEGKPPASGCSSERSHEHLLCLDNSNPEDPFPLLIWPLYITLWPPLKEDSLHRLTVYRFCALYKPHVVNSPKFYGCHMEKVLCTKLS